MSNKRARRTIYEAVALAWAAIGLVFTIPALINSHDTIALLAAAMLGGEWAAWAAYFIYRNMKELNQ